jgi:anti-sigma regulatory factor (Ser/Thr protein kinase)
MNATVVTSTRDKVFRRSFPPQTSSARQLRLALERYLTAVDVQDDAVASLLLCADEALINAVAHAPLTPVLVAACVRYDRLVLEVSDEGPGFDAARVRQDELPDLDADHGRGLFLIHQLMDAVRIDSSESGTIIRMELGLAPAEALPVL